MQINLEGPKALHTCMKKRKNMLCHMDPLLTLDELSLFFMEDKDEISKLIEDIGLTNLPETPNPQYLKFLIDDRYARYKEHLESFSKPKHFLTSNGITKEPTFYKEGYAYLVTNIVLKDIILLYEKGYTPYIIAQELNYPLFEVERIVNKFIKAKVLPKHEYPKISPKETQEALEIYSQGNMKIIDVALMLGISSKVVESTLSKAKKNFSKNDISCPFDFKTNARRKEITKKIKEGKTVIQIAEEMQLSRGTVYNDIRKINSQNDKPLVIKHPRSW